MKKYKINEIFYSLQGEGVRAGSPSIFIRFSGCNLRCSKEIHGFDCDTEFSSGIERTSEDIINELKSMNTECKWIVLTGGEPSLQLDEELINKLHSANFKLAIETNGSKKLPEGMDWICVSPKGAEHTLEQLEADEVKYVRAYGQGIPKTRVRAKHYLISPAFEQDRLERKTLEWCIQLVKENPPWRLSIQQHKLWNIR